MGQFFAVFRNTLLETVRQPAYGLILVAMSAMIAISPAIASHIYTFSAGSGLARPAERMVADLGLATVLLGGLFLAAYAATSVVYREIDNHTALTVLSKRVSRTVFVFGKYAGVALAITLASAVGIMVVLLTIRVGAPISVSDPIDWGVVGGMLGAGLIAALIATFRNYFYGRAWIGSFTLAFIFAIILLFTVFAFIDREYNFVLLADAQTAEETALAPGRIITYDWDVFRAGILTLEAVLVMSGIAMAASTRLGPIGNFSTCGIFFLGGLTSEYVYGRAVEAHASAFADPEAGAGAQYLLLGLSKIWYSVTPNLQTFWMSDALTREVPIPNAYVLTATGYAVLYIAAMLFLAAFLFQRREIA